MRRCDCSWPTRPMLKPPVSSTRKHGVISQGNMGSIPQRVIETLVCLGPSANLLKTTLVSLLQCSKTEPVIPQKACARTHTHTHSVWILDILLRRSDRTIRMTGVSLPKKQKNDEKGCVFLEDPTICVFFLLVSLSNHKKKDILKKTPKKGDQTCLGLLLESTQAFIKWPEVSPFTANPTKLNIASPRVN